MSSKPFLVFLFGLEPLSHVEEKFSPDRDAIHCATNLNCDGGGKMHWIMLVLLPQVF